MTATTRSFDPTALDDTLCLALELGEGRWKLGFVRGFGGKVLRRQGIARDEKGLLAAIAWAKERLALADSTRVVSLYEAGRDGFWLHRFLVAQGVRATRHRGRVSSQHRPLEGVARLGLLRRPVAYTGLGVSAQHDAGTDRRSLRA